jgi:ribosomal-protein-serine acetyltransferase
MGSKARVHAPLRRIEIGPTLALRTLSMEDAAPLFALVDKNRAHLREWMSWLDWTTDVEGIRPFLQSCIDGYEDGTSFRWALMVDGHIGGVLGLECIMELHRRAKIGYWLSSEHQGHGYVTQAVQALIEYGFAERKLDLIEIRAAVDNHKSRAVAARVGMTFEGVLRQREWLYDHYVDLSVNTLLASEWRAQRDATHSSLR